MAVGRAAVAQPAASPQEAVHIQVLVHEVGEHVEAGRRPGHPDGIEAAARPQGPR
ncbi:MAG: hypothetical protein Q8P41_30345 [Pseudomonadota bacterium]|nr:hypothetical protein [Pseudomonadota bacterium]